MYKHNNNVYYLLAMKRSRYQREFNKNLVALVLTLELWYMNLPQGAPLTPTGRFLTELNYTC